MSQPSQTTAAATPTPEERKKKSATHFDANPAKAGWATKLVLVLICFLWIVPLFGTLVTSFRTVQAADSSGWWTFLGSLDELHPRQLPQGTASGSDMGEGLINSFAITLPATFIPLLVAAFAAYAFTFMQFPGRDFLFLAIVSLLVVPNYVAFVPMLQIYDTLDLNGTFPAVWLAHIGFGMSLAIYILRNYMATLPVTVIESAKVDGASHFQTFWRLVLPMSVPALAGFAIFQFLWVWNDLLVALMFIGPGDNAPVTQKLSELKGQFGQGANLTTAGAFITMLVPVAVFLGLQRFFVRGLTAGAVKG